MTWTFYLAPFSRYSTSKISVYDLNPSVSQKVKYFKFVKVIILLCDYIVVFCWHELSLSLSLYFVWGYVYVMFNRNVVGWMVNMGLIRKEFYPVSNYSVRILFNF